jgi:hypothetical protein
MDVSAADAFYDKALIEPPCEILKRITNNEPIAAFTCYDKTMELYQNIELTWNYKRQVLPLLDKYKDVIAFHMFDIG